jgi:hypothetical protein
LLGKTNTYKAPKVKLGANIALSDSDLMVLLSEPDSIKAAILTNFATQVTPVRFLVTTASFLKECATAEDIADRWVTFFNALGIDDEPANWTKFYHAMLKKAIVLKELQDVKVIQLPPDDKELLQLIATHPSFKKMLVKAEGMKVVVYASHYKAFVNLLKEMGYLISISITG